MTEYERSAAGFGEAGGTVPLPADAPANLVQTRWLLEELRVSLFAQRLGTAEPVSPQRIAKALKTREGSPSVAEHGSKRPKMTLHAGGPQECRRTWPIVACTSTRAVAEASVRSALSTRPRPSSTFTR